MSFDVKPLAGGFGREICGLDMAHGIDPATDAQLIQGAVWACTERQLVAGDATHSDIRAAVLRSTLRGLGVAPQTIAGVLAQN